MENRPPASVDLQRMAALMAEALRDLDCPECCGPIHGFIESGANVYREELEWAYLVVVFRSYCESKR